MLKILVFFLIWFLGKSVSLLEAALLLFNSTSTTIKPHENPKPTDTSAEVQNFESTTNKPNEKDPWSLDLFENAKSTTTTSDTNVIKTTPAAKIQLKEPKIVRSLSQPQIINNTNQRFALFNLGKLSDKRIRPESFEQEQLASDFYLYSLVWACVVMLFWKNLMLLPILPIPILIYTIKRVGSYLGVWGVLSGYCVVLSGHFVRWCSERIDALAPVPIRGLYRILRTVNASLKDSIRNSIDTVSSCVVIFALLIFVVCASIFFVFQVSSTSSMIWNAKLILSVNVFFY